VIAAERPAFQPPLTGGRLETLVRRLLLSLQTGFQFGASSCIDIRYEA
jgi:hypothetical protein